jgi:tRNA(fMet)-specific endonuclease VapC
VTAQLRRGPVVIDTDVYGADLVPGSALAVIYEPIIAGRPAFISFQTVRRAPLRGAPTELGCSAHAEARSEDRRSGDGPLRARTGRRVRPLRVDCERIGHALGQRDHDADRWIAATALRLGVPLVSNDKIFENVPGLVFESATRR